MGTRRGTVSFDRINPNPSRLQRTKEAKAQAPILSTFGRSLETRLMVSWANLKQRLSFCFSWFSSLVSEHLCLDAANSRYEFGKRQHPVKTDSYFAERIFPKVRVVKKPRMNIYDAPEEVRPAMHLQQEWLGTMMVRGDARHPRTWDCPSMDVPSAGYRRSQIVYHSKQKSFKRS